MTYLVLCVLFSSVLYVIFKYFQKYNVNILQAIVVNYFIAAALGLYISRTPLTLRKLQEADWVPSVLIMGFLFIAIFNVMALTSQRNGLSVASVSGKMSLVIPVIYGIIVYNETAGWVKITGIAIALLAVYFTSTKSKKAAKTATSAVNYLFPALLFIGSGIIDTLMKHIEISYMQPELEPLISASIFTVAFFLGLIMVIYQYAKKGTRFQFKSVVGGIILGIPNYFSIVMLFKALGTKGMEASIVYPLNHVGTVLVTTIFGLALFKEKVSLRNWTGIALAVVAIGCIAFAKAN